MAGYILSIIVPCFNSFDILQHTLQNMEERIHDHVEFVIVDDCSTDDSYNNLIKYAEKSSLNIRLFKNENNMGAGVSRNNGLKIATGKYITFLDSDDYFSNEYFDEVVPLLDGNNDCIIYDFLSVKKNGKSTHLSAFYTNMQEGFIDKKETLVFLKGATWGKIYKKECVDKSGALFLDQKRNEDMPFTKGVIDSCEKIFYLN